MDSALALKANDQTFCQFDQPVGGGGYAWWYFDAISDDAEYGFTVIAFIGSVFSPYYAWSDRSRPENHCAINVALYGKDRTRWAMTERGSADLHTSSDRFQVGPSDIQWSDDKVEIRIREFGAPLPRKLEGTITLHLEATHSEVFDIAGNGAHYWQPIAPSTRVSVRLSRPDLSWDGTAYFDHNRGSRPLESDFAYWDWSRGDLANGDTVILYNTDMRQGEQKRLSRIFHRDGTNDEIPHPPQAKLSHSPIFRIPRRTASQCGLGASVIETLEDAPFYSRSVIETGILGERVLAMNESYVSARFRSPITKLMLPFRMPRRPSGRGLAR